MNCRPFGRVMKNNKESARNLLYIRLYICVRVFKPYFTPAKCGVLIYAPIIMNSNFSVCRETVVFVCAYLCHYFNRRLSLIPSIELSHHMKSSLIIFIVNDMLPPFILRANVRCAMVQVAAQHSTAPHTSCTHTWSIAWDTILRFTKLFSIYSYFIHQLSPAQRSDGRLGADRSWDRWHQLKKHMPKPLKQSNDNKMVWTKAGVVDCLLSLRY